MQGQDGSVDWSGCGIQHADRSAGATVDYCDRMDYGYVLFLEYFVDRD